MSLTTHLTSGAAMKDLTREMTGTATTRSFNYNKLQAAACIASSAMVSIAAIYWMVSKLS